MEIKRFLKTLLIFLVLMVNSVEAKDGYSVQDVYIKDDKKICFLTFDDGPSNRTNDILDILNEKGIKATFFVLGVEVINHPDILTRIYNEGHSIGNHTYSHAENYTPEKFINDLEKNKNLINDILKTDIGLNLIRFPYGSNSVLYKDKKAYLDKLREYNLRAIDWNVDSRDSIDKNPSQSFIMNKIIEQSRNKTKVVLLMHDSTTRRSTVKVLPSVIEYFQNNGFVFEKLASCQN
ncbi:MAG: polysaccharide deacetylase [Oscillospiraceae bacterium]|nr:polysaccharide deacetylase [Oscillospiraceae bacterium]